MPEFNLEEIAELVHEYNRLTGKENSETPENTSRLSRVDYLLSQVTLNGTQLLQMQEFDPLLLGNNDVKRSAIYGELKEKNEELERRYKNLQGRYDLLVIRVEEIYEPQFRLKDLLEKQRKEAERDY